jgi:hypothetical protein
MKSLSLILMLLCGQLLGYDVKMRVVDDTGAPVAGAAVVVLFVNSSGSDVREGRSGSDGTYAASGKGSDSVMLRAEMLGHYPAQVEGLSKDKDHDVEVVLPRILNPVPMYALRNVSLKFPVQSEWLGFDFEAAGLGRAVWQRKNHRHPFPF